MLARLCWQGLFCAEAIMIQQDKIISKSVLASIAISFCTYAYLLCNSQIVGALILSLSFIVCSVYSLNMFTCRVNMLSDSSDFRRLFLVLIINLSVIYLLGIIFTFSNDSITAAANNLVLNRINTNIPTIIISSTITGFLYSCFVESENRLKSLNFKPCYIIAILCTFAIVFANLPHCLIDMFLYSASSETFDHFWSALARLSLTVLFNFIGGSLFNIIANKSFMHSHID